MSWDVYGDQFTTAEMVGKTQTLRFKPTKNIVLKAIRTSFVFFNDPSFSNLHVKLYADRNGDAAGLIGQSTNSHEKADLLSDNSAWVETYFEFAEITLRKDVFYHFAANCSGYTYDDDKHISWVKAWPDPAYEDPITPTLEQLALQPYFLSVVGDAL